MRNQHEIWEGDYERSRDLIGPRDPSELALEASGFLDETSRILELGCGVGHDAAHLARDGHSVLALDHAPTAIALARDIYGPLVRMGNLRFEVADISEPLILPDYNFDLVFARLSLHYFDDERTRALFGEIAAMLPSSGRLLFMCKSVDDPLYGKGERIAPDIYDSHHLRHFFSEDYTRQCLAADFDILDLISTRGLLYDAESAFIKVLAARR